MQQLALDIGIESGPSLQNFLAGPNQDALSHLLLWTAGSTRSPVPIYLWGESGSGKTHLLEGVRRELRGQGAKLGWMDASIAEPLPFDESWSAVFMDQVHLYTAVQQHMAFNWFVNAQALQRGVLAAGELAPVQLKLREDLRTRLGWGHVLGLKCLGEPERRAVLRQEADARGIFLSDEVMSFMLNRFSRDLGSLMQLLDLLDKYALKAQRGISIPLIKAMLESM